MKDMMRPKSRIFLCLLAMVFVGFLTPLGYARAEEASYTVGLWSVISPETVLTGQSLEVELQVDYEFTEPTMIRAEIIDQDTEDRVAVSEEVFEGDGRKSFLFQLSAPLVETTWNLKANIVYQTSEGWVSGDMGWNDLFSIEVRVPTPVLEWEKTFGGTDYDIGYSVQVASDGGYIITGYTKSSEAGEPDVYLVKTDSDGNMEWNRTFGGTGWDYGQSVQLVGDDGYIIAGNAEFYGINRDFVYLVRTNSTGHMMWNKTYGSTGTEIGHSVQVTGDGGYIIVGETFSDWTGMDVYLVRTDSSGNLIWNKTLGGSGWDYGYSVQVTGDGGYIITGKTNSYGTGQDVYLIKTDSGGNMIWNNTFGGPKNDVGYSVQVTDDGGYIIVGETTSIGEGYPDVYLVRTNSSGHMIWNKTFGYWNTDIGHSVQVTDDGGYIIVGETVHSRVPSGWDVYVVKIDSDGNRVWEKWLGQELGSSGYSVQLTGDGGYIITGATRSASDYSFDVYLGKLGPLETAEETYAARIIDFTAPNDVSPGEVFTVDLTVSYEFPESTYMTPGIFNVVDGLFIVSDSEILAGNGTKSSRFEITAPEAEGVWALEARVWFISGVDSVHSDVDWFEPFDVKVTAAAGEGGDDSEDDGEADNTANDTGSTSVIPTEDDTSVVNDTGSISSSASEIIDSATSAAEEIIEGLPDEVKKQIPGFPYEAILIGLLLGFYLTSHMRPHNIGNRL